jgi:hypothetical protein
MSLPDFLLARIAEDEAAELARVGNLPIGIVIPPDSHNRVLAECEAKRRIMQIHACRSMSVARPICDTCWNDTWMGYADYPCGTLHALAAVYANHPDYRDEWKP